MNSDGPRANDRSVVIVLGMHRSGTSVLTRGLAALGVDLGKRMLGTAEENPKGFWENLAVLDVDESVLSELRTVWDGLELIDWTAVPEVLKQEFCWRAVRAIEHEFGQAPLIGFKDPRVARLLPVWQDACTKLGLDDRYVIVIRNPISVARSLQIRNGFAHEKSHLLWLLHVVPSLLHTRGKTRCIVEYDQLMESPAATMLRISESLRLPTDDTIHAALVNWEKNFVSEGLRHTLFDMRAVASDAAIPSLARALYEELLAAASGNTSLDDSAILAALQRANDALKGMAPILRLTHVLDQDVKRGRVEMSALLSRNESFEQSIAGLERQTTALSAELAFAQREIALLREERQNALKERDRLFEDVGVLRAKLDSTREESERLIEDVGVLRANLNSAREETDRTLDQLKSMTAQQQQSEETIGRLNADVEALLNSTSWKVTAPVRSMVTRARRMRQFLGDAGFRRLRTALGLVRPHLAESLSDPRVFARKARVFMRAWRNDGTSGIGLRLQESKQLAERAARNEAAEDVPRVPIEVLMRCMLPSTELAPLPETTPNVVVIVPVYKGVAETRACVESLVASKAAVPFEILVIDDASPEPQVREYLNTLGEAEALKKLRNAKNLGFVRTVNRGMSLAGKADVVLLNSDTIVPVGWLDRMIAHAYSDSSIGTVTPFSNNATICSYPNLHGWSKLPDAETVDSLDRAFQAANRGRRVDLPTAVGFCMYIKHDCLADTGRFDQKAFGRGYGEENDFCVRSSARGWKHVLVADVFVYHAGETSFGQDAQAQKDAAMKVIRTRYPNYERDVAAHVSADHAYPLRVAATAARYRAGQQPVVLFVTHNQGGGTEKHVRELANNLVSRARILVLSPVTGRDGEDLLLEGHDSNDKLSVNLSSADIQLLVRVLKSFGVARTHVHHTLGFAFSIESLVARLAVPYDLTLHDYHQLCPRINLFQPGRGYCGDPDPYECNACILKTPAIGNEGEIVWWRSRGQSLVAGADRVICPSDDARTRLVKYFPGARALTVPHEEIVVREDRIEVPRPAGRKNRLVAILGELAPHKGMQLVAGVIEAIHRENLAIEILLIGSSEGGLPTRAEYSETGAYEDEELPAILHRISPDIFLFAAQAQETYSYTLSAAIRSGRPIVVTNVGALPERVRNVPNAVVVPSDVAPTELASLLANMQLRFFGDGSDARPGINTFYKSHYLAGLNGGRIQSGDRRPVVAVIPDMFGQTPSPCAYIRLLIPMSTPDFQRAYEVHFVTLENALQMRADVFVTQRLSVKSVPDIDRLRTYATSIGARIIYDIDDYLIGLPAEHPENLHYADSAALVVKSLAIADETWVSTDALMREVTPISRSVKLVANELSASVVGSGLTRNNDEHRLTLRILYMGTPGHAPDLEIVLTALRVLHAEGGFDFELHLVGLRTPISDPWIRFIDTPATAKSYPMFMNWLMSLPAYDVGIAPLNDNLFNRCKSAIKYFDYTELGLVTIASELEPYRCIIDGENGFIASNTTSGWCGSIRRAYSERPRFGEILTRARDSIRDLYEVARANRVRIECIGTLESSSNGARAKSRRVVQSTNLDRELLAAAFLHGNGIEIGALHSPLEVPSNAVVQYIDRLPAEGLAEHYPEIPSSSFVEIDVIDDGETLSKIPTGTQDFVVANHFIEHAEDPIATIQTFLRVLRTGGVVFLAVPDKRATFDKDRELTSLAHLINDHSQGSAASRRCHYEEWVKFVEPNFGRSYDDPAIFSSRVHDLMTQRYSIHFHCWEPSGFMEMLDYLSDNMALPFEVSIFVERKEEFVVVLQKRAAKDKGSSCALVETLN